MLFIAESCSILWFSSVQFSCSVVSDSLRPHGLQHARLPCSPTPRVHPNPRPLSQWCHPTISSSVVPFSSCLQSFPASGSFPMSQFFASGGQSTRIFSFSISPSNEYSGLISYDYVSFFLIWPLVFPEISNCRHLRPSLAVLWLGPCASTAGDKGSIPRWGIKIPHTAWHTSPPPPFPKKEKRKNCLHLKGLGGLLPVSNSSLDSLLEVKASCHFHKWQVTHEPPFSSALYFRDLYVLLP